MSDPRLLPAVIALLLTAACAKSAPPPPSQSGSAPAVAQVDDVPPPPESEPGELDLTELAPAENRAPGSLSCLATGSIEEEFRLPVTAIYDPNSDFAHFSLDTVGESTVRCSLVITRWSDLPESGTYEKTFTREQLAEGDPEAEVFFVVDAAEKRWVADALSLRLAMGADDVSGEFSGTLVDPDGSLLQVSNGLFTAPLRRLAALPSETDSSRPETAPADPPS